MNSIVSKAYDQCPFIFSNNNTNLGNVNFRPDLNLACQENDNASFDTDPTAGIDINCLIPTLQNDLAATLSRTNSKIQHSFGFQPSTDPDYLSHQMTTQIKEKCRNKSDTYAAIISDPEIPTCQWHFVRNATDKSACFLSSLQKMANDIEKKGDQQINTLSMSTNKNADFLVANIRTLIMIFLIILIILILAYIICFNRTN